MDTVQRKRDKEHNSNSSLYVLEWAYKYSIQRVSFNFIDLFRNQLHATGVGDALIFAPEVMMAFFFLMTWSHEA
jgi:hypothetical protein